MGSIGACLPYRAVAGDAGLRVVGCDPRRSEVAVDAGVAVSAGGVVLALVALSAALVLTVDVHGQLLVGQRLVVVAPEVGDVRFSRLSLGKYLLL